MERVAVQWAALQQTLPAEALGVAGEEANVANSTIPQAQRTEVALEILPMAARLILGAGSAASETVENRAAPGTRARAENEMILARAAALESRARVFRRKDLVEA